jgi:hypothetical protein
VSRNEGEIDYELTICRKTAARGFSFAAVFSFPGNALPIPATINNPTEYFDRYLLFLLPSCYTLLKYCGWGVDSRLYRATDKGGQQNENYQHYVHNPGVLQMNKRVFFHTVFGFLFLISLSTCNLPSHQNAANPQPALTNTPSSATAASVPAAIAVTTTSTPQQPVIVSISICSPNGTGGAGSCPTGTFDSQQIVLAPDGSGNAINSFNHLAAMTDEHSSVFAPGMLGNNKDYLFFVASGSEQNHSMGVMVLSGGSGPDGYGQWTFDYPRTDGYGSYPGGFGPILIPPTQQGHCPTVPDGNPAHQDQTFDLNYAAAGSLVIDSTGPAGSLLMVYEGVNTCEGEASGRESSEGSYMTTGLATSRDYGRTWPTYRGGATFDFVLLPLSNQTQGPNTPTGAFGKAVCIGNDWITKPPASYGRYEILSPSLSLATVMATGKPLSDKIGEGEPSAFVDDINPGTAAYLYVIHGYSTGKDSQALLNKRNSDLMLARAELKGGRSRLRFFKWNGSSFVEPGIGGAEVPILPDSPYQACGDQVQGRHAASISYVEETQQYLLTFVCASPTDPTSGHGSGIQKGSAWFYSTSYDLSDPRLWSTPQEIIGSWSNYNTSGECRDYRGWYPTFMSLGLKPGHLSSSVYVFYLWGCQGGGTPGGRQYLSRAFTITIH